MQLHFEAADHFSQPQLSNCSSKYREENASLLTDSAAAGETRVRAAEEEERLRWKTGDTAGDGRLDPQIGAAQCASHIPHSWQAETKIGKKGESRAPAVPESSDRGRRSTDEPPASSALRTYCVPNSTGKSANLMMERKKRFVASCWFMRKRISYCLIWCLCKIEIETCF